MFKDVKVLVPPNTKHRVVFQCDEYYYDNFAIYNLLSCNNIDQDVHIHFINPSKNFLDKVLNLNLKINLSISTEILDTDINFYKLKSYYFVSRYFVANMLFDLNLLDSAYITDADIVFNEKIIIPDTVSLGVLYYPQHNNLWKQTGANFLFVKKERQQFLKNLIADYFDRLSKTDFNAINDNMDKITRSNIYALDQVCMSHVLQKENDFFNLISIPNLIGKFDSYKIWTLTGGKQKNREDIREKLRSKFNASDV